MYRIGTGWDAHVFEGPGPLRIGGVNIQHEKGLKGHSDADVLIHSICDALLGAAGMEDLGMLFPAGDDKYKDVDSRVFLSDVGGMVKKEYRIVNIDSVVIAQRPKLYMYYEDMKRSMSETLNIEINKINVKAKSPEGLGAIGRREGIAAQAVALLKALD